MPCFSRSPNSWRFVHSEIYICACSEVGFKDNFIYETIKSISIGNNRVMFGACCELFGLADSSLAVVLGAMFLTLSKLVEVCTLGSILRHVQLLVFKHSFIYETTESILIGK